MSDTETRGRPANPAPVQVMCAFPECTAFGCFGFRESGIDNLAHRRPDAPEVWVCSPHREQGPQLLALKIEVLASERQAQRDVGARERAAALAVAARQREGMLL